MKVIKRDGSVDRFYTDKITNAITLAMDETEKGVDFPMALKIANNIYTFYNDNELTPSVEEIQDDVEEMLADFGRFDVAKRYILYREERNKIRSKSWEMDELQRDIYENKYRHDGESFDEFIERVSGGNSSVGELIRNKDFIFGGRILAGRGIDRNVSLANCTTLPPIQDNIESIFDTSKELARMFSYGQGAGIDISNLRPRGAKVNNASKTSTGAISFMKIFDTVGEVIGAEGRRSALLIAIDAEHDDLEDFINVKNDLDKVNNANLSVKASKGFMKQDTEIKKDKLKKIAQGTWNMGEPALLYWDNNKEWHLLSEDDEYVIEGVNACSEYPTTGYGTCLLGSINLSNYVLNPYSKNSKVDIERLAKDTKVVTIGMNEVLDEAIPTHPLKEQRDVARNYRQIGIGIMGLGDLFIKMGVEYGGEKSIELSELIISTIRNNAIQSSIELAKKHGSFPKFSREKISKSEYFKSLPIELQDGIMKHGIRNSSLLSIAPAGSISLLCDVSNGLEPLFAKSFTRTTKSLGSVDKDYVIYPTVIKELMEHLGIKDVEELPDYCVTAHNINPFKRIELQSILQKYVDLAISSTLNLNEEVTVETIVELYKYAHKMKLKGISMFRNNCFRTGILKTNSDVKVEEECST